MKWILGLSVLAGLLLIGSPIAWSLISQQSRSSFEAQAKSQSVQQQKEEIASLRTLNRQLLQQRSKQLKLQAEELTNKRCDRDCVLEQWEIEASARMQQFKSTQNYSEAAANLFDLAAIRSARSNPETTK